MAKLFATITVVLSNMVSRKRNFKIGVKTDVLKLLSIADHQASCIGTCLDYHENKLNNRTSYFIK